MIDLILCGAIIAIGAYIIVTQRPGCIILGIVTTLAASVLFL